MKQHVFLCIVPKRRELFHDYKRVLRTTDLLHIHNYGSGRAMAQAVSRRPLTTEARVRSPADPSGRAV